MFVVRSLRPRWTACLTIQRAAICGTGFRAFRNYTNL